VRTPDAFGALDFLEGRAARNGRSIDFGETRKRGARGGKWQILNASVNGIKLAIGGK